MTATMIDFHEEQRSVLLIVIDPHYLSRMQTHAAITLGSEVMWRLGKPAYPESFSLKIACEEDWAELNKVRDDPHALLKYVERGNKPEASMNKNLILMAGRQSDEEAI